MSLEAAEAEVRERFSEASMVINHLRTIAPADHQPVDDLQKTLRGLCLVSIYAAFERSANAIIEAALVELTSHETPSTSYITSLHGLMHYAKVKSLRACGFDHILDRPKVLFDAAFEDSSGSFLENPLAERMQNVDGGTLEWLASLFGVSDHACAPANRGRLGNLRERRNAVAHGREAAGFVGGRFSMDELSNVYNAADMEVTRFLIAIRNQCDRRLYIRRAA